MVAIKSLLAAVLGLLAVGVVAVDDRRLVDLPNLDTTCALWTKQCSSYAKAHKPSRAIVTNLCEPGKSLGGSSSQAAVTCAYTATNGKTTDVTAKVIAVVGLVVPK